MNDSRIFIGGIGRSGTSIMAEIFHNHKDILYFPESRFLVDSYGLNDFLNDKISKDRFKQNMINKYRKIINKNLKHYGRNSAEEIYSESEVEKIINQYLFDNSEKHKSASIFLDNYFNKATSVYGKKKWVEKTPHTFLMANTLYKIYNNLLYIHMLREPKDVCSSMLCQNWGPNTVEEFIEYWNEKMTHAFDEQKYIPKNNYIVLSLEQLMRKGDNIIVEIFSYAGIDCSEEKIENSINKLDKNNSHIKRWPINISPVESKKINNLCYPIYLQWKEREKKSLLALSQQKILHTK